jgi:hypothetical protein
MGTTHPGDTGHNGFGRAPLADCSGEIDDAGHALGGPWRFAVYGVLRYTCVNIWLARIFIVTLCT